MEDFANTFHAWMYGIELDDYMHKSEDMLSRLDVFDRVVKEIKVENIDNYKKALEVKGILSALFCYAFNNRKDHRRVGEIEEKLGEKLYRFARNYRKASKEIRPLIKYMLWNKYFLREDVEALAKAVLEAGHLFKIEKKMDGKICRDYLVTGLHLAVGDNTFTVGKYGREYRNYVKTCAIQAIYVTDRWQKLLDRMESRGTITVPLLDETIYDRVLVGNGKGMVKISMYWRDIEAVDKFFSSNRREGCQ